MIEQQPTAHLDDARRFLTLLARPGDVFELRALSKRDGRQRIGAGFFNDMSALARSAIERSGRDDGIYITINPVHPGLLSRLPANRVHQVGNGDSTSDRDVVARRHLLIDIDPVRPANISSNDAEHQTALELARYMQADLAKAGWPEPIFADSGNGAHLIYGIDLPRDDGKLVERVLSQLSRRYSTAALKIDEKVFNPARISKIYGTLTRKGQSTPDRPHRVARICSAPDVLAPVPRSLLDSIAPLVTQVPRPLHRPTGQRFDLEAFIAEHLPGAEAEPWTGGEHGERKWILKPCPFNSAHDRGEAHIVQMHSGAISAGCKHDSCNWTWQDLRGRFAPARLESWTKRSDRTAPSTQPKAPSDPTRYRLTQLGNAERFVDTYVSNLRYVGNWKSWLSWDGKRWKRDHLGSEAEAAKAIIEQLFVEAGSAREEADRIIAQHADILTVANNPERAKPAAQARAQARETKEYLQATESDDRANTLMAWAMQSSTAHAVRSMVELARSNPRLAAKPEDFDRDAWLINCQNGTVDLRTGELRPHCQDDMLTRIADVEYDPESSCVEWEKFLTQIMPDENMRDWLQRFAGYCLTGLIIEQMLAFFLGVGGNGKNVWTDTMLTIMGDYAATAAPDLLVLKNNDEHPTGFADLQGRRLVVVSEIDHGRKWAESTIKRLTGDKYVKARFMRENFFSFENTLKFCIMANSRPEVRETNRGIWRRMRVVPFDVIIPEEKQDTGLLDKLKTEHAGVFAWAVRGCIDWRVNKLPSPIKIARATKQYEEDQDVIRQWVSERCFCTCGAAYVEDSEVVGACKTCGCEVKSVSAVVPTDAFATIAEIQADYVVWCKERTFKPWSWKSVRAELLKIFNPRFIDPQKPDRKDPAEYRTANARGIRGVDLRLRILEEQEAREARKFSNRTYP